MIEFLLRARASARWPLHTLRAMARGGIYDQIGGGFARYSVDARWIVPHFEKMLYDNALLARAYLHGWQVSGEPFFARVCAETLDWALRELRRTGGRLRLRAGRRLRGRRGQLLRVDAGEVREALGDRRRRGARATSASPSAGNFEGANILGARGDPIPRGCPRSSARLLGRARAARAAGPRRQAPDRVERADDRRARRGRRACSSATTTCDAAVACAEFVLRDLRDADGRLLRTYNRGRAKLAAYLEDHAFLLEALLTLYEATFDPRWFARGARARRHDPRALRRSRARRLLLHRRRPRGADRAAQGPRGRADPVRRLGGGASGCCGWRALTGEHRYEEAALGVLRLLHPVAAAAPAAFGHLLQALDFALAPVREVAIVGADAAPLERVVRARLPPARRARRRRATATCRCSRAASRWTAARRRTCASASRAGGR